MCSACRWIRPRWRYSSAECGLACSSRPRISSDLPFDPRSWYARRKLLIMRNRICRLLTGSSALAIKLQLDACRFARQREALLRRQQPAAMERIDERGINAIVIAHHEMPGQADAAHRLAEPARDLHINQRKRDGNAGARREHFVQAAIASVVIIARVAVEAQFFEQIVIRGGYEIRRRTRRPSGARQFRGVGIQQSEKRLDRQPGKLNRRQLECGLIQIDVLLAAREQVEQSFHRAVE